MDDDVQVTRGPAADASFPIRRRTQSRSFSDSGGNLQLDPAQFFHASFARVTQARLLAAYADRWPADGEMRELCQLFEMRLAALPTALAEPAGAAA